MPTSSAKQPMEDQAGQQATGIKGGHSDQRRLKGWNYVIRGGRVVKATTTPPTNPNPNPTPKRVMEVPEQPTVTTSRRTARPEKPEPKTTAAPVPATGKFKKKAAMSVKTATTKSTIPNLVVPTPKFHLPTRGNL